MGLKREEVVENFTWAENWSDDKDANDQGKGKKLSRGAFIGWKPRSEKLLLLCVREKFRRQSDETLI